MKPGALTAERRATHGDWKTTARAANRLKLALRESLVESAQPTKLNAQQLEALDMILGKIARIVSGDPNHPDHWDDIAGYALLGRGGEAP